MLNVDSGMPACKLAAMSHVPFLCWVREHEELEQSFQQTDIHMCHHYVCICRWLQVTRNREKARRPPSPSKPHAATGNVRQRFRLAKAVAAVVTKRPAKWSKVRASLTNIPGLAVL